MNVAIENEMMRRRALRELRENLGLIIDSHREETSRLMDIFESLALETSSVSELSREYNLSEAEVMNAFGRARTILSQHTSLRPYLDLLD